MKKKLILPIAGMPVYLSGTAGILTVTAPTSGFSQIVGYTESGNVIRFRPEAKATAVE